MKYKQRIKIDYEEKKKLLIGFHYFYKSYNTSMAVVKTVAFLDFGLPLRGFTASSPTLFWVWAGEVSPPLLS